MRMYVGLPGPFAISAPVGSPPGQVKALKALEFRHQSEAYYQCYLQAYYAGKERKARKYYKRAMRYDKRARSHEWDQNFDLPNWNRG